MKAHDLGESRMFLVQTVLERDVNAIRTQLCHPMTIVQELFTAITCDTDLRHLPGEKQGGDDSRSHRSVDSSSFHLFDAEPWQH